MSNPVVRIGGCCTCGSGSGGSGSPVTCLCICGVSLSPVFATVAASGSLAWLNGLSLVAFRCGDFCSISPAPALSCRLTAYNVDVCAPTPVAITDCECDGVTFQATAAFSSIDGSFISAASFSQGTLYAGVGTCGAATGHGMAVDGGRMTSAQCDPLIVVVEYDVQWVDCDGILQFETISVAWTE